MKTPKNFVQRFTIDGYIHFADDNDNRTAENVTELCDRISFIPKKIVQVGAANDGDLEYSKFVDAGAKVIMFEPHPEFYSILCKNHGNNPNITIFNLGIYNKIGKFKFLEKWAASCLEECHQTAIFARDENHKTFEANCAMFSGFDEGDIDLLLLDTEGAEWHSLEKVISRPLIICVETHSIHNSYVNPFFNSIHNWMSDNNYVIYAVNESDSVFIRGVERLHK